MSTSDRLDKDGSVRAVSRSIAVLQAINRNGSVTLTQIADAAALPYPTTMRIVRTLIDEGLVEQEPARKRYRPTALVQTLSCGFQNHDRLVSTARPHIVALTRAVDWPVSLATRVGCSMIVRDSTSSMTSLTFNNYFPGWQVPLFASASGRVYFAYASPEEQTELLRNYAAEAPGPDSLTVREFREGDLATRIRAQGYASVARTGYSANPGKTSSIAVPLFEGERLLGALALVFFASAVPLPKAIEQLLAPLQGTADAIRADLDSHAGIVGRRAG